MGKKKQGAGKMTETDKRKIQEWSNNGYFGRICEFYVGEKLSLGKKLHFQRR